jgi:hypothetical protein
MQHPRVPDGAVGDAGYVAVASWDGAGWRVSVPSYCGTGAANTTAATLAEAVPNAVAVLGVVQGTDSGDLLAHIGIEVHLPDDILKLLEGAARLTADAASELRGLGISDADITAIVAGYTPMDPTVSTVGRG